MARKVKKVQELLYIARLNADQIPKSLREIEQGFRNLDRGFKQYQRHLNQYNKSLSHTVGLVQKLGRGSFKAAKGAMIYGGLPAIGLAAVGTWQAGQMQSSQQAVKGLLDANYKGKEKGYKREEILASQFDELDKSIKNTLKTTPLTYEEAIRLHISNQTQGLDVKSNVMLAKHMGDLTSAMRIINPDASTQEVAKYMASLNEVFKLTKGKSIQEGSVEGRKLADKTTLMTMHSPLDDTSFEHITSKMSAQFNSKVLETGGNSALNQMLSFTAVLRKMGMKAEEVSTALSNAPSRMLAKFKDDPKYNKYLKNGRVNLLKFFEVSLSLPKDQRAELYRNVFELEGSRYLDAIGTEEASGLLNDILKEMRGIDSGKRIGITSKLSSYQMDSFNGKMNQIHGNFSLLVDKLFNKSGFMDSIIEQMSNLNNALDIFSSENKEKQRKAEVFKSEAGGALEKGGYSLLSFMGAGGLGTLSVSSGAMSSFLSSQIGTKLFKHIGGQAIKSVLKGVSGAALAGTGIGTVAGVGLAASSIYDFYNLIDEAQKLILDDSKNKKTIKPKPLVGKIEIGVDDGLYIKSESSFNKFNSLNNMFDFDYNVVPL